MEAHTIPARPWKVTLAVNLLCLGLGIGVTRVVGVWLLTGSPGLFGSFLIEYATGLFILHSDAPVWIFWGTEVAVPIACWLYYMIAKGKNWARLCLLIIAVPETLVFIFVTYLS